jgi:hypothetical protein
VEHPPLGIYSNSKSVVESDGQHLEGGVHLSPVGGHLQGELQHCTQIIEDCYMYSLFPSLFYCLHKKIAHDSSSRGRVVEWFILVYFSGGRITVSMT